MSSTNYFLLVQKILESGKFADIKGLADEIGMDALSFQTQLELTEGMALPDIVKLKLLQYFGVTGLLEAIQIVDSVRVEEPPNEQFFDTNTGSIRWLEALDSLKNATGLIEDKQFADYLKISTSTLSDFRRGKSEISGRIKLRILDHLGFHTIASGLEFFLRDELAAVARRARQRQAKKIAEKNALAKEKNI
jgi:transcriptional regulator with XRE-family HTH domain